MVPVGDTYRDQKSLASEAAPAWEDELGLIEVTNPLGSSPEIHTAQFCNNSKVEQEEHETYGAVGKASRYYIRTNSGYITTGMTCLAKAMD